MNNNENNKRGKQIKPDKGLKSKNRGKCVNKMSMGCQFGPPGSRC